MTVWDSVWMSVEVSWVGGCCRLGCGPLPLLSSPSGLQMIASNLKGRELGLIWPQSPYTVQAGRRGSIDFVRRSVVSVSRRQGLNLTFIAFQQP